MSEKGLFIIDGDTFNPLGWVIVVIFNLCERVYYRLRKPEPISMYVVMLERFESQIKIERLLREKGFTFKRVEV